MSRFLPNERCSSLIHDVSRRAASMTTVDAKGNRLVLERTQVGFAPPVDDSGYSRVKNVYSKDVIIESVFYFIGEIKNGLLRFNTTSRSYFVVTPNVGQRPPIVSCASCVPVIVLVSWPNRCQKRRAFEPPSQFWHPVMESAH